jgi:hypothetical protein
MEDPIQSLLSQLLAAKDAAEIDRLSTDLRSALHERIETVRRHARSISRKTGRTDRRRIGRQDGGTKKR